MRVTLLGARGIPARYSGFETFHETRISSILFISEILIAKQDVRYIYVAYADAI